MMDELELLKKDWQRNEENYPKFSESDIYPMLLRKSSSIVRWIFYISIIEFILPHLLFLVPTVRNSMKIYEEMGLHHVFMILTAIQYTVVIFFMFQFYKRYREISVLDNAKKLLSNILKTRRTVKHYVLFCLSMIVISYGVFMVSIYLNDNFVENFELGERTKNIAPEKLKTTLIAFIGVIGVFLTVVMGVVYFLLYGLLLRKLKKNYKELQQLEV
ncbi:hypothetical protein U1E44_02525 [Arenibacter sp. GZD96]|uniref:hypothetical protein n=1 Tax=Aurantibrevibacter litoralis TaxID=3106030 RepID=UPI002AFF7CE0|nr:hypothetical protein [Arenibacter sp. GZD-96]MEA1784954.1 hypothetical protein [Arenibacter sp. GZD-96]